MVENIFMKNQMLPVLEDYLSYATGSRENLGEMLPVAVYRMLEYSLKEELRARFGKEEQIALFRVILEPFHGVRADGPGLFALRPDAGDGVFQ